MKHIFTSLFFIVLFMNTSVGQDSLKTDPIIYGDIGFGSSAIKTTSGIQLNTSLNYQYQQSLVTIRFAAAQFFNTETAQLSPFTFFSIFRDDGNLTEWSLLYGRRMISGGVSFSISAGAPYNDLTLIEYPMIKNNRQDSVTPACGLS
jgi:hypothetical protein